MRRHKPSSSDESPETLWILSRPPEPDGPSGSRAAWGMLARAAVKTRPRVLVERPPASWSTLQAAMSGRGVSLLPGWSFDEEGFRRSLRAEIRGRHFAGIFVLEVEAILGWLPWTRLIAPSARVVAVLTEEHALARLRGPGTAARRRLQDKMRRAFSQADEIWCSDEKTLRAVRTLLRGRAAPRPTLVPAESVWARRGKPPSPPARIEAVVLGGADEARIARTLERVAPGRPRVRRVPERGEETVAALNAALFSARAPLIWLCQDSFEAPDESLLTALAEGLAARPYAGGVLPVARPLAAGRSAAHFRATWAINHKGDWHEADRLSHCCCLLLRRDALLAAGALDERLRGVDAALVDLFLRLALAGRPLFEAHDALMRCPAKPAGMDLDDREMLAGKWGSGALHLLEFLSTSLEPPGYRVDPTVQAGFQGMR